MPVRTMTPPLSLKRHRILRPIAMATMMKMMKGIPCLSRSNSIWVHTIVLPMGYTIAFPSTEIRCHIGKKLRITTIFSIVTRKLWNLLEMESASYQGFLSIRCHLWKVASTLEIALSKGENNMDKKLLTPDEFIAQVPVGKSTLYRYLRTGQVPSVKICGRVFIPASYLEEVLRKAN